MKHIFLFLICLAFVACEKKKQSEAFVELHNPVIPGYFADPSIVEYEGKFYLYVTADPWGADFLSCWVSDDFQNWTFNKLNWPTKEACTSPTSNHNNVWAPSVVKKGDAFYMYISVGSEVWCGKASHPLGPWENMLGDKPMIPFDTTRYYHVIDAEAFIDDDGKAYLYWGSGWEWINGHCFAVELNDDMSSFKSEPVEVTPTRYFEGPFMIKHNNKYYLTYSEGKTIDETYEVRYAVGNNPLGTFTEATNSPILTTNDSLGVYGPGHHTIFNLEDKKYILYHRHSLPFAIGTAKRQTCINELKFDNTHLQILNIVPDNRQHFPNLATKEIKYIRPESIIASSEALEYTGIKNISDNDYSTRWETASNDSNSYLIAKFDSSTYIDTVNVLFEYPWKTYFLRIESSTDDNNWKLISDHQINGVTGSPVNFKIKENCTFVKILFDKWDEDNKPSIWELRFY
jgi:beta-xylosidase